MMTTGLLLVVGMWSASCARLGLWMACLSRAGAGQVSMTGTDGLLPALHQGRPWRGAWPLGLSEHLGYDRGEPTSQARGNARNGTTSKTVDSSGWGPSRSGCPGTGPGPSPRARVAPRASADRGGLDACESPGLMRRWNDGAGYPAPPGLHAQRGRSAWGPFRGPADAAC